MWLSSRPFLWQPSCFSFWSGVSFNTVASCPWTTAFSITSSTWIWLRRCSSASGCVARHSDSGSLCRDRYSFERLRDSRTAYSEAKTGIDYLPLRLCTLDLKAAAAFVQRAHVRKHEAELYPELKLHLKKRGIDKTPEQWGDGI